MIAVIPFTSKVQYITQFCVVSYYHVCLQLLIELWRLFQILEPCQSSLAYRPPNPWTMGILALLAEIYAMPNLKMNLKFDIEVHDSYMFWSVSHTAIVLFNAIITNLFLVFLGCWSSFQVLFKNLGVQIKDVTPTSLLRDRMRVVEGNPDFSNKDFVAPQPPASSEDQVVVPDPIEPPKPQLPVPISPVCPRIFP